MHKRQAFAINNTLCVDESTPPSCFVLPLPEKLNFSKALLIEA
jgi:hypothetical protein